MVTGMQRSRGFTLVEMVVAIALSAIIAGFAAMFLSTPVRSYIAQTRRSELAESADIATRWITRDAAAAVSNSLRAGTVSGRVILEMIPVVAVAIYRHAGTEGDTLNFAAPDSQFDVLGAPGVSASYVIVNNLGVAVAGANAYALTNVIAPASINANSARINLTPAFRFAAASPNRRAFLASNVTRYECDLTARTLRRYTGLPITPTLALTGAASTLIASDVAACRFVVTPGNTQHGGVLVMELTLSRATNGDVENLRVLRQIRVENPA
jgi:MSHA biogenesis protein MshO